MLHLFDLWYNYLPLKQNYKLTSTPSDTRGTLGQRNLVFRATVLKTLGRVGSAFFKNWNLNYKDPNEKKKVFS